MRQGSFKPIYPNPYIVGNPIRSRDMFFGRVDEFRHIAQALDHGKKTALIVLFGERRSGKSSILYQIQNGQLGQAFLPIFVDMQIMAGIGNEAEFFGRIITDTGKMLGKTGPEVTPYILQPDDSNPAESFRQYLQALQTSFPGRAPLVLIDEYEILENKITEGCLSRHVLTFFGGLLESEQVSFVFTGSKRLESHNAELWGSELLQKATSRKISFLTRDDTARLVTQPLGNQVTFTPEVLEQIYVLTAGQPFYTQLLCQNLVYHLNEVKKNLVERQDLETVVNGVLENPPPQLIFNWGEHLSEHKLALALLAEFSKTPGRYLSTASIRHQVQRSKLDLVLNDAKLKTWLTDLCKDEYLLQQDYHFSFRLDLFRRWIRHDHNIWQVKKEIGQEELDRICEREREKKEKKKKIIIVLERVALALAVAVVIFLVTWIYHLIVQQQVEVSGNAGPFNVIAVADGERIEFHAKTQDAGNRYFDKKKLRKGKTYVFTATLGANNETLVDTVKIADEENTINFEFKKYPVTVITDAASIIATLGDTTIRTDREVEPWKCVFYVCAGTYKLHVKDLSTQESREHEIKVSDHSDSIYINFDRIVITLQAKFPFAYRHKSSRQQGEGRGERRAAKSYSAILRGGEKGKTQFTFINPETKQENLQVYSITADTLIMIPQWKPGITDDSPNETISEPTPRHRLQIYSKPSEAQVVWNDTVRGLTPFDKDIKESNYEIELRKRGYDTVRRVINLTKPDSLTIDLIAQNGYLKVIVKDIQGKSPPGVSVYGKKDDWNNEVAWGDARKLARSLQQLMVGQYKIRIVSDEYREVNREVSVFKNDTTVVEITLEKK